MSSTDLRQDLFDLLRNLRDLDGLKKLFWTQLNYDRVNEPLSRGGWSDTAKAPLAEDPILFASGGADGDFHIIYSRLASDKLLLTDERPVVSRLLREHPYALFVFSTRDRSRWHFVNVKDAERVARDEHEGRKQRLLFRRIAVGREERLRTATERLTMIDLKREGQQQGLWGLPPLQVQRVHDEAFDVEKVTEEFYADYRKVFADLQKRLVRQVPKSETAAEWAHDYALQLLNRLMFLYFIQRKRWLGDNPEFIGGFWQAYKDAQRPRDTFFSEWLSILFFEAFNKKFQGARRDRAYLPAELRTALQLAPYLNGGLFTQNKLDEGEFTVPDAFFELLFERFEGQTPGLFERYNFTIAEDTPFDQEVAVDPEMIGKVYESLVNVSTEGVEEEDQRGAAGIFYTPRVEIDLMCRLALLDYLTNHLGATHRGALRDLVFAYDPDEQQYADGQLQKLKLWPQVNELLRTVTALDITCGSGSFIVGMLLVLDDLQARANRQLGVQESPYERRKRIIGASLYGVDVMRWAVQVAELRLWLQLVVETELAPEELQFQPLLPNLSFKIRAGDSLVQEVGGINFSHRGHLNIPAPLKGRLTTLKSEKRKFYDNADDRKFRTAEQVKREELDVFKSILNARADELKKEIRDLNKKIEAPPKQMEFAGLESPKSPQQLELLLQSYRDERDADQSQLDEIQAALAALRTAQEVPFVWDIAFVEIFEGEREGFDILVGNPPYVRQEMIAPPGKRAEDYAEDAWKALKKDYKEKLQRTIALAYPRFFGYKASTGEIKHKPDGKSDLYIYFYFYGLSLLNPQGAFCFITSNSWLDVGYGADLQEFLLRHSHVRMMIDNQVKRSFKQAEVNTVIALLSPGDDHRTNELDKTARFVMFKVPFEDVLSPVIFCEIEDAKEHMSRPEFRVIAKRQADLLEEGIQKLDAEEEGQTPAPTAKYGANKWGGKYLRAPDIYWMIIEKGGDKLVRLGDVADVRFAIKTGANEFFTSMLARLNSGDLRRNS